MQCCLIAILGLSLNLNVSWAFTENTKVSDTAVNNLSNLLNSLNTFQAHFKQQIFAENGSKVDEVSGEIGIKKPNRFYWNVSEPFIQKLIADGKYLWQYDEDLEQATVRNLEESLGNTPAGILSGKVVNLAEKYHIKALPSNNSDDNATTIQGFSLTPIADGQFEQIILYFENKKLRKLVLKDTLAQTTKVDFSEVKTAIKLPDSLFLMVLPKGVDIVDSRVKELSAKNLKPSSEN